MRAISILKGDEQFTLSDAKRVYLKKRNGLEVRQDNRKLRNMADSAFDLVISYIGDREFKRYRRTDVTSVIQSALTAKLKTTTIKRRLGVVRAAVNDLIKEYELDDTRNPFNDFDIPNLGEDATELSSLDTDQVKTLRGYVGATSTDTANIMGLLLDTGSRIAEVVGLWCDDIVLDAEIPHVVFTRIH